MGPFLCLLCQLALTIIFEGAIIILWKRSAEILKDSLYVNLLTNPAVNLIIMLLSGRGLSPTIMISIAIALEINVVFIEAIAYKFMLDESFKKVFVMSLILNISSYLIGNILGLIGYWDLLESILRV